MPIVHPRQVAPHNPRRQIERLVGLPLRPATARFVLGELAETLDDAGADLVETTRGRAVTDLDPGWSLRQSQCGGPRHPLALVADLSWWPASSRDVTDLLNRLWRHAVAVSLAARRLAREASDPDADRIAQAGLLHGLGRWAIAAIDPESAARLASIADPLERRGLELRELGATTATIGRDLAERWGCDPLIADAAWLHSEGDRGLEAAARDPARLVLIQRAFHLAEQTPWALDGRDAREHGSHDPRVKLLTAEVQSRCGGPFLDADATPREERLSRSNARLHLRVFDLTTGQGSRDRLFQALASSDPTDTPESWASGAGLAFCGEPTVTSAQVIWGKPDPKTDPPDDSVPGRPPSLELPLEAKGQSFATVQLWSNGDAPLAAARLESVLPAWQAWGELVVDRTRLAERLARVHDAYQRLVDSESQRLRDAKLDALGEFAAGAGHELNNPLAVIVGRAQLLMVGETDPKAVRSLRAILTQAQRAHRILRDLMYVARPVEPRPRFCQPDEIVRASLRDARADAEEREVRLSGEALEHGVRVWADPEGLRHLADMLIRNALESTPRGGIVRVATFGDARGLRWTIHDSGRGITPAEGGHLFDPFFCGRAAGRGLGLGLPRASRFVTQAGGEIRWQSTPGQGSTFTVRLPLAEAPKPILAPADATAASLKFESRSATA